MVAIAVVGVQGVESITCEFHSCEWGYDSPLYEESEKVRNLSTCLVENQNFEVVNAEGESINDVTIQATPDDTVFGFAIINSENVHFLPSKIAEKFPKLTDFQASDTLVTFIGSNHFKGLTELARLNLKGNKIESFGPDVFSDCKGLEFIDLSHNQIKYLPADLFHGLPNFGDLDVMYNELTEIPKDLFINNPKFQYFCGCYNKIKHIDPSVFGHPLVMKRVMLVDNACINGKYDPSNISNLVTDLAANCTGTHDV